MSIKLTYKDGTERDYDPKSSMLSQLGGLVKATLDIENVAKASRFLSKLDNKSVKTLSRPIVIEMGKSVKEAQIKLKKEAHRICNDTQNKWVVLEKVTNN